MNCPAYKPLKSIQIVGADFDSTIAANQLMPEVNTDFRYVVISRQNQGSNKIVTAIAPSFERRYLRSGDNNGFSYGKSNHLQFCHCCFLEFLHSRFLNDKTEAVYSKVSV